MQTAESEIDGEVRSDLLKDAFEAIRARARYLENWHDFYKWSILSGIVGILGGLGAVAFSFTLNTFMAWFDALSTALPDPRLIAIIPAFGGLLVGLIRYFWVPEQFDSPCATDAMIDIIHVDKGRARLRTPFATILVSSITLASGGSAGRECPTALIGTGFGSLAARLVERLKLDKIFRFTMTKQDIRTLAICGAAAGLGAVFHAPIGSALFATSVLYIYGMEYDLILPAMIAALTSYIIFSMFYGFESLFNAPFVWEMNVFDVGVVLVIGVACSLAGLLYLKVFYGVFRWFQAWSIPAWAKPAVGGLLMGLLVLLIPRVWGMGYETIQDVIDYKLSLGLLALLVLGKILASSFSIGSGGAGGVIAPSLFIGAALGGALGTLATDLFPGATAHPTLYVVAGMGALYASVGKVPLSTAILLCETTRNFTMIVPLIIATTAGFLASGSRTIYESQHADATGEQADILSRVPVEQVMVADPVVARADMSVIDVLRLVGTTRHHGFPVLDEEDRLVGVISWKDAQNVPYQERETCTAGETMTSSSITLKPYESARKALDLIESNQIGRVVIVDLIDQEKVVGIVTKEDLLQAYSARIQATQTAHRSISAL